MYVLDTSKSIIIITDEHGRQDFSMDVKSVTLLSGSQREDHRVCIEISNDNINEENEGFLLVLSVDELDNAAEFSGPIITRGRVALALIMDNDSKYSRKILIIILKSHKRYLTSMQNAPSCLRDLATCFQRRLGT